MDNFEKYAEYTRSNDWRAICEINGIELDSFGTKKELKALPEYLEPDEVVFAITSGIMNQTETSNSFDFGSNTWLVVLTSDRFLFLDAAMLTKSVDTQSVRHDHVQAVSASQGLMFGKIQIDLGSRIVVVDNCHKSTVKVMANLANRWIKELSKKHNGAIIPTSTVSHTPLLNLLEKLEKMFAFGALSEQEFHDAKNKLLKSKEFNIEKENILSLIP